MYGDIETLSLGYTPITQSHTLYMYTDRIVGTADMLPLVQYVDYLGRAHSGHNPQQLRIGWGDTHLLIPT